MTDQDPVPTVSRPTDKENVRALGSRIVERRTARGWKQRELARRTGIEPGRLSRIERGLASPNLEELACLREAFEGSVDELLFGEVPAGPDGSLDELARDLERLGSRQEIAILRRLFQLLILGYRHERRQPATGDDRT